MFAYESACIRSSKYVCAYDVMVVRHVVVCICVWGRCVCLCRFYVFVCVQFIHNFIYSFMRVSVWGGGCLSACVLLSMWASAHVSECVYVCVFVFMCVSLIVLGMYGEGVARVCAYSYEESVHLCVWSCLCTCGWGLTVCAYLGSWKRTCVQERVCLSCGHVCMFGEEVVPACVCIIVCTHVQVSQCMHMCTIHASNHTFIHVCIRVYLIGRMRVSGHVCLSLNVYV